MMDSLGYFLLMSIEDITSLHYNLVLKLGLLHALKTWIVAYTQNLDCCLP
jgi:hypothetical protein